MKLDSDYTITIVGIVIGLSWFVFMLWAIVKFLDILEKLVS